MYSWIAWKVVSVRITVFGDWDILCFCCSVARLFSFHIIKLVCNILCTTAVSLFYSKVMVIVLLTQLDVDVNVMNFVGCFGQNKICWNGRVRCGQWWLDLKLLFTTDCILTCGQLRLEQGLGHRDKLKSYECSKFYGFVSSVFPCKENRCQCNSGIDICFVIFLHMHWTPV